MKQFRKMFYMQCPYITVGCSGAWCKPSVWGYPEQIEACGDVRNSKSENAIRVRLHPIACKYVLKSCHDSRLQCRRDEAWAELQRSAEAGRCLRQAWHVLIGCAHSSACALRPCFWETTWHEWSLQDLLIRGLRGFLIFR